MLGAFGYKIPLSTFDGGLVSPDLLMQEMNAAPIRAKVLAVEIVGEDVNLWFDSSSFDMAQVNRVVSEHRATLQAAQAARYAAIDARTDALIAQGFLFAGMRFSISLEAQVRTLAMFVLRDDPLLAYPVVYNSMEDDQVVSLANAQMVQGFFLTGVGYYRAAIDSGSALKAAVRAATSVGEALAVSDSR